MRFQFLVLLIIFSYPALSQPAKDYSKIDAMALQIPDSSQKTTSGIARYIEKNFIRPGDQTRAVFAWLANNIQYDVDNMYNVNFNLSKVEIIDRTMKTRKAVCQGYAEVFCEIADKLGIKNYLIEGYTRQNEMVSYLPHAWCAVYLDNTWSFIDPTWGSGNIQKGKYVKQMNNYFYLTPPEKLITSHIAFDPMFQFLYYPVTNQEFSQGITGIDRTKSYFNYTDTLKVYESQTTTAKLESEARRIEANGVNNPLVYDRLQYIRRELQYQHNKSVVDLYNSAVADFNQAVALLNEFIQYRNHQFVPLKADPEIRQMTDTVQHLITSTEFKLNAIHNPDQPNENAIRQLKNNIKEVNENLEDQKAFLNKYFNTSKFFRKSLFYSYKRK